MYRNRLIVSSVFISILAFLAIGCRGNTTYVETFDEPGTWSAGSDIDVDVFHDKGTNVFIHGDHESEDVTIEKHKRVKVIKSHNSDGVTIISCDEIDEETRVRLEEVLKDAGTDGTIMFIDGSELSGDEQAQRKREVRVIKKEVDVTN